MTIHRPPPSSEAELLNRAQALAGCTLQELAERVGKSPPRALRHAKGWTGSLIEELLGATALSLSEPDFQLIGVELKTIPVNRNGRPRESTYVCTVPLTEAAGVSWEDSCVWRKLQCVLWLPIEADPQIRVAARKVGYPVLWRPTESEQAALRADWEELMELVCVGQVGAITARHGNCLQIRPKAANSRQRIWGVGEEGEQIATIPRGFYLRAEFTEAVLSRHYVMPAHNQPG